MQFMLLDNVYFTMTFLQTLQQLVFSVSHQASGVVMFFCLITVTFATWYLYAKALWNQLSRVPSKFTLFVGEILTCFIKYFET